MGVKEVDRKQRSVPTDDQLRLARLTTTDGGVVDEDKELKQLIKKVTEAAECTKNQAEIALFDNDNDVDAAVLQIIENPDLVWTEQKNRKDKKKDEEIAKPFRGQSSNRGRKEWSDKTNGSRGKWNQGGLNASSTTTRGPSRGAAQNGRGGGRGNASTRPPRDNKDGKVGPTENGNHDENHDWKNGALTFERSEESAATATDSTTSAPSIPLTNGSSSTGPISFAAAAAAGVNKERQRQQQKFVAPVEESKPSISAEDVPRSNQSVEVEAESSVNTCIPAEEESLDINQPSSTTTTDLANKIKADLGMVGPVVESFGPPEVINPVEFVSDAATSFSALQEYQFGFNSEPVESVMPLSPANQSAPAVQIPEPLLFAARSPIVPSSSQVIPPKAETLPSQNGEFSNLKSSPPNVPVSSYAQQMPQPRGLSYDTSSVSYAPPDGRATLPKPQPPTTQPMHVQNPPPTHQQPQQMPYGAPQMQYSSYPYMSNVNMYSPLRNEDPSFAAAALMQYPFGMSGQIDLSQLLPQGTGQSQQLPQQQHRSDNPQMMDLKFQSGVNTARDSGVGPPPGFANPNAGYMPPHPQQNLQSLFLQQQYGPSGPFPYMMQPAVNAARPMYGAAGDDDRKNFERNAGKQGGAQQTPPPHYQQQHNGYMQGLGKPKPQQNYGQHTGWN